MTDSKAYLDEATMKLEQGAPPVDCWIVYKTTPPHGEIVGAPLAIYGKKESLYQCFDDLCSRTSSRWGITIAAYWFDDPK